MVTGAKVRYAVVGLGATTEAAVLPAFRHSRKNSELMALVSNEERKLAALGRRYGVRTLHGDDEYPSLLESGAIDAVYLATPPREHKRHALQAIEAGVHVLCEKPLALTELDCREILAAARANGVKLATAYRLHFERANQRAVEKIRGGAIGDPRVFDALVTMQAPEGSILTSVETGGGPLYELGVYCVDAARYVFAEEPEEVVGFTANSGIDRFRDVDDAFGAVLRFPRGRLATFLLSLAASPTSACRVVGTDGALSLDSAHEVERRRMQRGSRPAPFRTRRPRSGDLFAPELLYFSACVLDDVEPEPSGLECVADVRVVDALLRSVAERRAVPLEPFVRPAVEAESAIPAPVA